MVHLMNQREPSQTSMREHLQTVNYFQKKLYHRCLTWIEIRLCKHNFTVKIF